MIIKTPHRSAMLRGPAKPDLATRSFESPVGTLHISARGDDVTDILLPNHAAPPLVPGRSPALDDCARQLEAYFAGKLRAFDLPLAPTGTPFQQMVWRALLAIPYGETCSYADVAAKIGRPSASRAVGAANGKNPIAIVVPCHRVVGANGSLTGYGGGMDLKRWLLAHEGSRSFHLAS